MLAYPNCPICIESFDNLANIAACACGHTFHYGCIVGWAKRCLQENQPCLCPTCKTRFETNAARGIVKKLYFNFDSNCAKNQNDLKKKLELAEAALESYKRSKAAEIEAMQDELKMAEAKFQSLLEENLALKQRTDVLSDIANLANEAAASKGTSTSTSTRIRELDKSVESAADERVPKKTTARPVKSAHTDSDQKVVAEKLQRSEGAVALPPTPKPTPKPRSKPPKGDPEIPPNDVYDDDIRKSSRGQYEVALSIHPSFMRHIHGVKGHTRDRLERESQTTIQLPPPREDGDVVVTAYDKGNVYEGKMMILDLVDDIRAKMPYTHFISFPLNGPDVKSGLYCLFHEVSAYGGKPLSDDLLDFSQHHARVNFTIGSLVLLDEAEVETAIRALEYCREHIIWPIMSGFDLEVSLRGVYSNGRHRLHTMIEGKSRHELQKIADMMVDHFSYTGLMPPCRRPVALEATIADTLFLREELEIDPPDRDLEQDLNDREIWDGRKWIVKNYGRYDFGDHNISEVHLSIRNTEGADQYYQSVVKLDLSLL